MELDFENRPDRRDFDVQQSFKRWVYPSIILYFVVCMGLAGLVGLYLPVLETFYALFPICILFGFPIIWIAGKKQDHAMKASHSGYNVLDDETRPFFLFGMKSFKKYRKDTGGFQGMRIEFDKYANKMDDREQRQREMPCEVCGEEPGINGGYFVEHRVVTRILGLRVRERIKETDAYCVKHEPRDFV